MFSLYSDVMREHSLTLWLSRNLYEQFWYIQCHVRIHFTHFQETAIEAALGSCWTNANSTDILHNNSLQCTHAQKIKRRSLIAHVGLKRAYLSPELVEKIGIKVGMLETAGKVLHNEFRVTLLIRSAKNPIFLWFRLLSHRDSPSLTTAANNKSTSCLQCSREEIYSYWVTSSLWLLINMLVLVLRCKHLCHGCSRNCAYDSKHKLFTILVALITLQGRD